MIVWLVIIALLAASVIGFLHEPRRLRIGVLLLAAIALTALGILGMILGRLDDPYNETAAWLLLGMIAVGLVTVVTLAAFLVFNGLVMARRESRSLPNMLSLIAGIGLLGYVGIGLIALSRNEAVLALWVLMSIPPIAYLGFVFSAFIMYAWLYGKLAPLLSGPVSTVVVLGAGLIQDRVTPLLAGRLTTAKAVYERALARNARTSIIVSGGQGGDEAIPEAEAMSLWLSERGVPSSDIIAEPKSRSTRENLQYSAEILDQEGHAGPIAVITSNYHAFRAATLMQALGISGYSVGAPTARYFWPSAMIREFIALLRDHVRLNIAILSVLVAPLILFSILQLILVVT